MSAQQPTFETIQQTIVNLQTSVDEAKAETKRWQVVAILLPVLATVILGFVADRWKLSLQETIDQRSQQLSTRLALTEEYYKQKLAEHERLHKQMVVVMNSLKDARFNTDMRAEAVNRMRDLYDDYSTAGLYVSPDLLKLLKQFAETATNIPPLSPHGTASIAELRDVFEKAEKQMVKDLQLAQISTVR
jgi:hypothetical protein